MSKEEQFNEMVMLITEGARSAVEDAEALYNAGYRKASEIFAEIEEEIELAIDSNYRAKREHMNNSAIPNYDNFNAMCDGKIYAMRGLLDFIAELKKKYTEGGKKKNENQRLPQ